MWHIEWRHDGRRITLPILILRPAGGDLTQVAATALLDTGANVSGIVRSIARTLDLRSAGKRPLISARGEIQVERYLFRIGFAATGSTALPAFPFVFEETLGFELGDSAVFGDGSQLDAVLGMDILRQCDFEMTRSGLCRLHFH